MISNHCTSSTIVGSLDNINNCYRSNDVVIVCLLYSKYNSDEMSMKKLIDLSKEEQDNFLDSFDVVLSDVDGEFLLNSGENCLKI